MDKVFAESKDKMDKAISVLHAELNKLRTGRASTVMLDTVKVDYYGTETPLNQMAQVQVPEAKTLIIQPYDMSALGEIEKAITNSGLGLNPNNDGKIIRITIPDLNEERRKELVKIAKKQGEDTKVAIRNVRRDGNEQIKKLEKDKEISQDDLKRGQEKIQEITDKEIKEVDAVVNQKEAEIMEV